MILDSNHSPAEVAMVLADHPAPVCSHPLHGIRPGDYFISGGVCMESVDYLGRRWWCDLARGHEFLHVSYSGHAHGRAWPTKERTVVWGAA